jgi:hypothetical protein
LRIECGTVDCAVQLAKPIHHKGHQFCDGRRITHVTSAEGCVTAKKYELTLGLNTAIFVPCSHNHLGAARDELLGSSETDTRGPTGDQRNFSEKVLPMGRCCQRVH